MGTYKGIQGYSVQSLASDPTVEDTIGQFWYNSASNVWKVSTEGSGAWATGGALNQGIDLGGYTGIQTAAMYMGGRSPLPTGGTSVIFVETYNGSSWTNTNDLTTAVYKNAGFGTTTAAISAGGQNASNTNQNTTFSWNGTCFTSVPGTLDTARGGIHGTGTSTAGIIAGGLVPANTDLTETYDGSTWSETGNLQTTGNNRSMIGTTTAALCVCGVNPSPPSGLTATESWNGSSWTTVNSTQSPHGEQGSCGTTSSAMIYGGMSTPGETKTLIVEAYDGTSWSETADISTARTQPVSASQSATSATLMAGGTPPGPSTSKSVLCEEWSDPVYAIKTVTTS